LSTLESGDRSARPARGLEGDHHLRCRRGLAPRARGREHRYRASRSRRIRRRMAMPRQEELIADEARRVYGMAVNAMREAIDDNGRLLAVRDFSRKLDASHVDAFDLVSEMAINVHSLDPDLVQGALAEGQRLRARDLKDAASKPSEIGPPAF